MKVVVVGGTGLIGKKVVDKLTALGHEAVVASPSRGINSVTGEGLAEALAGAAVVVDVSNTSNWEDRAVLEFFENSTRNLLAHRVGHLVALSIVGLERVSNQGYMRAKLRQEQLIRAGGQPYTIVRATQFAEFAATIANGMTEEGVIRLPQAQLQLIAAEDVADQLVQAALAAPFNGTYDIAGPRKASFEQFVREYLAAQGDPRKVVVDPHQTYFGVPVVADELTPTAEARLGKVDFLDWLAA
ncbi:NmrA family transcriptional regulator [bacterium SCN 62-11]|nr:SDR family oxidoreductase [Candidatus Eremiobacteraeota bacterium]ODT64466.1 MAG: NmrA family transcriptional regulator [bacterium SCN 62-11]